MCSLFSEFMHHRMTDFALENHLLSKYEPLVRKFESQVIKPFALIPKLVPDKKFCLDLEAEIPFPLDAKKVIDDMRSKGFAIGEEVREGFCQNFQYFYRAASIEGIDGFKLHYKIND